MKVAAEVVDQIDWHWTSQLRPRFEGLTDDEYFWEPVRGCWSLRPRGTAATPLQGGSGDYVIEFAAPPPEPAPVTTIGWGSATSSSACSGHVSRVISADRPSIT
ncbi:Uncharacterised protein [Mycobacteroides abscessus]|nr:Uncharacterised protein [Mycobacteroides abscessus]